MQHFIAIIAFVFILSSCSNNSKSSLSVFKATLDGFKNANKTISFNNILLYQEFENKLFDARFDDRAKIWNPKVIRIKELCSQLNIYIQKQKDQLKDTLGVKREKELYETENFDAVNNLFTGKGVREELLLKLKEFKKEILNVDPKINKTFENRIEFASKGFESSAVSNNNFSKIYFNHLPVIGALALLSKFENNVLILENQLVTFCNLQQGYIDEYFSTISILIGQNSNYLKGGDELEITAGIWAFSSTVKSEIMINDKPIQVVNGVAVYKIKTQQKAGKYFVPVKIEYVAEDGRKEVVMKNISYTILEVK